MAVDDRQHSDITHIATAISVQDLRDQVAGKCAEGTPVPSVEWLHFQDGCSLHWTVQSTFLSTAITVEEESPRSPLCCWNISLRERICSYDERLQLILFPGQQTPHQSWGTQTSPLLLQREAGRYLLWLGHSYFWRLLYCKRTLKR